MRLAVCWTSLAFLLVGGLPLTQAQDSTKKPPRPTEAKSRFSPELIELLHATSSGYELNGQMIAPAMDIAVILKAVRSNDPKIQELGRLSCDLVYLFAKLQKQQPDPEIERIAKANTPDLKAECLKIVLTRVKPEELVTFGISAAFIEKLVKEGRKECSPNPMRTPK